MPTPHSLDTSENISIISVGTEITDGQILDTNSCWLSQQLEDFPLNIVSHQSVPDDNNLIQKALQTASNLSATILISGGLGPTSDDFTRDIIAEFSQHPLEFRKDEWEKVLKKLTDLSLKIYPGHKRQCQFPKGSTVLNNSAGIAPGFITPFLTKNIIVLPGPPREVKAIWKEHLQQFFKKQTQSKKENRFLYKFASKGMPESDVANLAEQHFFKLDVDYEIGYRLHTPYVETKIWLKEKANKHSLNLFKDYEKILAPCFVTNDINSLHLNVLKKINNVGPVLFFDHWNSAKIAFNFVRLMQSFDLDFNGNIEWGVKGRLNTNVDSALFPLQIYIEPDPAEPLELPSVKISYKNKNYETPLRPPKRFKANSSISQAYILEDLLLKLDDLLK